MFSFQPFIMNHFQHPVSLKKQFIRSSMIMVIGLASISEFEIIDH